MPVEKKGSHISLPVMSGDLKRYRCSEGRIRPSFKTKRREYFIAWWIHYCCFLFAQLQAFVFVYQYTGRWCDVNIAWWCICSLDVLRDVRHILFTWPWRRTRVVNPIPIVFDYSLTNVFLIDSPHPTEPASSTLSVSTSVCSNWPVLFI